MVRTWQRDFWILSNWKIRFTTTKNKGQSHGQKVLPKDETHRREILTYTSMWVISIHIQGFFEIPMAIQLEILQKTKKTADPEQKDQFHVLCFF